MSLESESQLPAGKEFHCLTLSGRENLENITDATQLTHFQQKMLTSSPNKTNGLKNYRCLILILFFL